MSRSFVCLGQYHFLPLLFPHPQYRRQWTGDPPSSLQLWQHSLHCMIGSPSFPSEQDAHLTLIVHFSFFLKAPFLSVLFAGSLSVHAWQYDVYSLFPSRWYVIQPSIGSPHSLQATFQYDLHGIPSAERQSRCTLSKNSDGHGS